METAKVIRDWLSEYKVCAVIPYECFLPPANVVCEGYIFTGVCDSVNRGGMHGFIGGHAWFYSGAGMVLFGGHAWFYSGGVHGFIRGACVVLFGGGMRSFIWGVCGFIWGGMHGFIWGGMHGFIRGCVHGFSSFFGYNEMRSMSGQYASYWNAFLFFPAFGVFHVNLEPYRTRVL